LDLQITIQERASIVEKWDTIRSNNIDLDGLKIVGHCRIGTDRYSIVEVDNGLENLAGSEQSTVFRELTKQLSLFEINGQLLAIIDAQVFSDPSSDIARFLTKREMQIATLVARGNSNKQIAIDLNISEWTVSTHLRRIFVKLEVDTRAAMVYRCADLLDR
jgi:DNA-binding CsgD family transcriptional regulator